MRTNIDDQKLETLTDLKRLRAAKKPLFGLGMVYATPAVMLHLVQHVHPHDALLTRHRCGDYGDLDADECRANDRAVLGGGRILSLYVIANQRIWIATDAEDDEGTRTVTTLCFGSEA